MSVKIRIKRGPSSTIPQLSLGEPALAVDTNEIYIGSESGNLRIHPPQYSETSGDSDKVDGYHASTAQVSGSYYSRIPVINNDGEIIVGRSIRFSSDSQGTTIYRVEPSNNNVYLELPSTRVKYLLCGTDGDYSIYVDSENGSDNNDGSAGNPFRTISRALSELGQYIEYNCDIYLAATGTRYDIDLSSIYVKGRLFFKGLYKEEYILNPSGYVQYDDDPDYGSSVKVSSLTFSDVNWSAGALARRFVIISNQSLGKRYLKIISTNTTNKIYLTSVIPETTINNSWTVEIYDPQSLPILNVKASDVTGSLIFESVELRSISGSTCQFSRCKSVTLNHVRLNPSTSVGLGCTDSAAFLNSCISVSPGSFPHIQCDGSGVLDINGCVLLTRYQNAVYASNTSLTIRNGTRVLCQETLSSISAFNISYSQIGSDYSQGINVINQKIGFTISNSISRIDSQHIYYGPLNQQRILYKYTTDLYSDISNFGRILVGDTVISSYRSYSNFKGSISYIPTTANIGNISLTDVHHILNLSTTSDPGQVQLPDATTCLGRVYIVKKSDLSLNRIFINPYTGQTIGFKDRIVLDNRNPYISVLSDGTSDWKVIEYSHIADDYLVGTYNIPYAVNCTALTTLSLTSNRVYLIPFFPKSSRLLARMLIEVTTSSTGTGQIGYYDSTSGDLPNNLIAYGTFDCGTTGVKYVDVNLYLQQGRLYWLAVTCSAAPTVRAVALAALSTLAGIGSGTTAWYTHRYVTTTGGVLPSNIANSAAGTGVVPAIYCSFDIVP